MNKRIVIPLVAIALTFVVIGCFAAQLYQQKSFNYVYTYGPKGGHLEVYPNVASMNAITIDKWTMLGVTPSMNLQSPIAAQSFLTNQTRLQIYDYIDQNPGLQFRALCSALCLPVGLAEYHLGVLIRAGLVSYVRDGRYKRFFITKRFSKAEMATISLLRHRTAKRIVEVLLQKKALSHCVLAGEVSITSQALTWQMKTLANTDFVLQVNEGLKTIYSIDEASVPTLQKYLAIVE